MRQYGFPKGNAYSSERNMKAASARAVENRLAAEEISDELYAYHTEDDIYEFLEPLVPFPWCVGNWWCYLDECTCD